jgi:two-component system, OmpR family, phosphate regulon sensor histidine kinase PhoR
MKPVFRIERRLLYIFLGLAAASSVFAVIVTVWSGHPGLIVILVVTFSVIMAIIMSRITAGQLSEPVRQVSRAVRDVSRGDYGARVRISSVDEISELADSFNELAQGLQSKISTLSEERARLKAILGAMVEGVMILDSRGNILMINAALEEMFRLEEPAVVGRPSGEVLRHSPLIEFIKNILEQKRNLSRELAVRIPHECWFHVQASFPRREEAEKNFAVLVFHNITEIKRLERVRKDFVANVSHEIRTPLTSIKGYVEALLDGAKDDPKRSLEFLQILKKHSDQLGAVVADLLTLAQIESGQVAWNREPIHLAELAEKVMAMLRPIAQKKRQQLIMRVPNDLPAFVGDSERMAQVLVNLVENAVKYTPQGGTIRIEGQASEQGIEVAVADNGIGIPPKDLARIFERFYRVDQARSRELGGTGLGLSIVKHIVEHHEGSVRVESEPGKGSRFSILLPIGTS